MASTTSITSTFFTTSAFTILFLLLLPTITHCQQQQHQQPLDLSIGPYYYEEANDCYDQQRRPQQCQPAFVNVAYDRLFSASNTCHDGEDFCIQTGNTGSFCDVCRSGLVHARHLTDPRNNTWWQSSSMLMGMQYPASVNLTLDLGKSYHITYIRLKFHSLRPESFAIYKRNDPDGPWQAFQYYSSSCLRTYGVRENEVLRKGREDIALCDNRHTDTLPTSGGTVAFSTLQGRPSAREFKTNTPLQNWVTAREIKITLNRMNTFGDEFFKDPNVLKSYFYAISDIAIGGRCNCNGHASSCDEGGCRCEHHTTGVDCGECLPLYNSKPWGKATQEDANECIKCECNGFSNTCYFDRELFRRTGDGGHCTECNQNRFGAHCEMCAEGYYSRTPEEQCRPCDCNPMGSRNHQCDLEGVCACKEGVEGEKCDRCQSNFYGLGPNGCRACECSVAGSLNNLPECYEGRCRCKENVKGDNCNTCKSGYYGLNAEDPFGCIACHCNGHSQSCQTSPGYHIVTLSTDFARGDGRWKAVDGEGRGIPVVVTGHSIQVPSSRDAYLVAPVEYLGDKTFSYNLDLSFTLHDHNQHPPSHHDVIIESSNGRAVFTSFSSQGNPAPSSSSQSYRFKLNEDPYFEWGPGLRHSEFMDVLRDVVTIKIKTKGQISSFKLQTAEQGFGPQIAYNVERCECPEGYVGQFCESCSPGFRRHSPVRDAPCVPCNCNGHSDACDPISGRCICNHNTVGESCERCAPGFYGNALNGRPDDCQACPCPNRGQCEVAGGEVVCKECMPGYAGNRCEECADGYYGDPQGLQGGRRGCQECNCNGNIDPNVPGNCDKWTGQCLRCIYNTAGNNCDRCLPNHHGNPLGVPRGQCKPCECSKDGSMVDERGDVCNTYTGQCLCKRNVVGVSCDKCAEGFWNIHSSHGCERCECSREGSTEPSCDALTGECVCKAGVVGAKCERCLPGHFGFSMKGCTACDCNKDGSVSAECDVVTGRCQCREGVEGRACDRCVQNRYLGPGGTCVECPDCYKLVQALGDNLKQKLTEMRVFVNYLLHENHSPHPPHQDHHHFESTLHHVNSTLVQLWREIKHYRGGYSGGATTDELSRMQNEIYELIRATNTIHVTISSSVMRCEAGSSDLNRALVIINNIEQVLTSNEQKVQREGLVALMRVYEAQKHHGTHSQALTRIAHQARNIVKELEMTSEKIEEVTNEALRRSEEALRLAQQSQATPNSVVMEIDKIKQKLSQLHQKHQETKAIAESTSNEAKRAFDLSLQLLTTINSLTIPSIPPDDEATERSLRKMRMEAERLEREATDLVRENQKIINDLNYHLKIAKDTYKRAIREQQVLEELLAEVDSARARSMNAILEADEAYKKAQNDLNTLQQFDEKVRRSKRLSQEAMHKKDKILEKIKEAEELTSRANRKLANSDQDAIRSKQDIDEAAKMLEKAFELLRDMATKTNVTKQQLLQFNKQSYEFKVKMNEVLAKLDEASRTIEEDEKRIQMANEDSALAHSKAFYVLDSLEKYRKEFERMINEIKTMEDYDVERIRLMEMKLKRLEMNYQGQSMFAQMQDMRQINLSLNILMDEYEGQMNQLLLDVKNIAAINATIPRACFWSTNLEPTDPRIYV